MRPAIYILLVVIAISATNARYCQSLGYFNNFFNQGQPTVRKAFQLGTWLEASGWKTVHIPVIGSVAVLAPCFPGVSPAFGHAGRVTDANTGDGHHYSFTITAANQGCTVSEWHSACRAEVDCDDVSEWRGLSFNAREHSSCASFYTPPISPEDFFDDFPSEPSPQLPAGSGLCTVAHLRLRRTAGTLGEELVVIPRSREVLDLDRETQIVDDIAYRAVEYTNPMGQSFEGWAADSYLGPCAMIHYASDVLGPDEQKLEQAKLTEVSDEAPLEPLPGWTIGVMSALGFLLLVTLVAVVVLVLAVRHYRSKRNATMHDAKELPSEGFVQFHDLPTVAVMPSLDPTA